MNASTPESSWHKKDLAGAQWGPLDGVKWDSLSGSIDEATEIFRRWKDGLQPETSYPRTELREMEGGEVRVPYKRAPQPAVFSTQYGPDFNTPPADARCEGGPNDGKRLLIRPDQRHGARKTLLVDVNDPLGGWEPKMNEAAGRYDMVRPTKQEPHIYQLTEWVERFDPDDPDTPPMHRRPPYDVCEHYWIWVWKGEA